MENFIPIKINYYTDKLKSYDDNIYFKVRIHIILLFRFHYQFKNINFNI